jgi:hypothetical protein
VIRSGAPGTIASAGTADSRQGLCRERGPAPRGATRDPGPTRAALGQHPAVRPVHRLVDQRDRPLRPGLPGLARPATRRAAVPRRDRGRAYAPRLEESARIGRRVEPEGSLAAWRRCGPDVRAVTVCLGSHRLPDRQRTWRSRASPVGRRSRCAAGGRGGGIRTHDLVLPKHVRYHCATPRPISCSRNACASRATT